MCPVVSARVGGCQTTGRMKPRSTVGEDEGKARMQEAKELRAAFFFNYFFFSWVRFECEVLPSQKVSLVGDAWQRLIPGIRQVSVSVPFCK